METRVAIIAIIVKDRGTVSRLNNILHEYGDYIIGRMGLPYSPKKVSIMSVAIDAPQTVVSALSGKIGALQGINVKTAYADA